MASLLESTLNTRALPTGYYRYIRSDYPGNLTDEEIVWLYQNNITTIVDLREEKEYSEKPCRLETEEGFIYYHLPVTGGGGVPSSPDEVAASYLKMIDKQMEKIISTIMNAASNCMFFCTAGKDRTGVVSAIILKKLGYSDKVIIDDYMETKDNLTEVLTAYAAEHPEVDIDTIIPNENNIKKVLDMILGATVMTTNEKNIAAAKNGFEAAFAENNFYVRQTGDDTHLKAILDFLPIRPGMKILDLGAGTGYLTFAVAEKYPDVKIVGLDIVEKALENDRKRAEAQHLSNITFLGYDGVTFPFSDNEFDMVVSRYVPHHFPDIEKSISEISRVLSDKGYLFISDPTPNSIDESGFIDEYMQVKPDGHVKFYSLEEWVDMCRHEGLQLADSFKSSIRFPRKKEKAYSDIIEKHDKSVVESYDLKFVDDEVYVTEQVNNILFFKE